MLRSRRDGAPFALLAAPFVAVALAGCPSKTVPLRTAFAPGEHATTRDGITLGLAAVAYAERSVTVVVTLVNRGDRPVQLAHDGIVFRYEELEYPLQRPPSDAADPIVVAPAGEVTVELSFALGPPPLHDGTLLLRSAKAGERWLEGLHVRVPGPPPLPGKAAS